MSRAAGGGGEERMSTVQPPPLAAATDAARTAGPALPSPLYKPLRELTEEDIAQVTREDCRRFLKEKGMRRPSWNKSQAIQQVISLKALLETNRDDDGDGELTAPSPKRRATQTPSASPPVASAPPTPPPAAPSPASGGVPSSLPPVEPQMIIFYGGVVNVYDSMPLEKAMAIMKVAADPISSPDLAPRMHESVSQTSAQVVRPIAPRPPPVPTTGVLLPPLPQPAQHSGGVVRYPYMQQRDGTDEWRSMDSELEGPAGRRASLQRYLEKRKDRKFFKCRRTLDGISPSDFELFFSQRTKPHVHLGHKYSNEVIPLTHPLSPGIPKRNCFIESRGQTLRLPIDLNDDDAQEV